MWSVLLKIINGVYELLFGLWINKFIIAGTHSVKDSVHEIDEIDTGGGIRDRIFIDGQENIVCDLSSMTISNSMITIQIGKNHDIVVNEVTRPAAVAALTDGGDVQGTIQSLRNHKRKRRRTEIDNSLLTEQMPLIEKTGILKKRKYVIFARNLADLLMAGNRKEIDRQFVDIDRLRLSHSAAADLRVVTLSYNALAACFDLDISEAWKLHSQAKEILPYTENYVYLTARVVFLEGYIHRKEKKYLGRAENCFKQALQLLHATQACSFHGDCMYNMACIDYDIFRSKEPSTKWLKTIAGNIRTASRYLYEDNNDITLHTRCRHMVKMANVIIDSDSRVGRSRDVTGVSARVQEAQAILDEMETDQKISGGCSSKYVSCCLLQGRANCCFRLGEYENAEKLATEAFTIADKAGFNAEIQSSRQLLIDIQDKRKNLEHVKSVRPECADEYKNRNISDDCFADASSNMESDDDNISF